MKRFQVKIDFNGEHPQSIFDATDDEKEVFDWLEVTLNSDEASSIAVYELNEDGKGYHLCQQYNKQPEVVERLIGFGRW
jgi:hypothetical protein